MSKIQVFIADDHKMMREGLSLLLNNQPDIKVIGEAIEHDAIQKGAEKSAAGYYPAGYRFDRPWQNSIDRFSPPHGAQN